MINPPKQAGFFMPAEWEPHQATWLTWPHNRETWPQRFRKIIPVWLQMVKALHLNERVHICIQPGEENRLEIEKQLRRHDIGGGYVLHEIASNDAWMRDHGPTFLLDKNRKKLGAVNWIFNAWGEKYPPWEDDARISATVIEKTGVEKFVPEIVLEGGSIEVNGAGCLLTTEQCLLNKNRNPSLSREEIEQKLKDYLGVEKVLWLGEGIAGDDTDGHVDDMTRFVDAHTIVTVIEEDPMDENHKPLQDNLKRLKAMTDVHGQKFRVVTLPMPQPVVSGNTRFPASYANFYMANAVVLLPVFNDRNDEKAEVLLQNLFPGRRVVKIPSRDLIFGLGGIHCVTQQQPAV